MDKIIRIIKYPAVIISLVLLVILAGQIRSCINERSTARISELEGRIQEREKAAEAERQKLLEEIQEQEEENKRLLTEIESLEQTAAGKKREILDLHMRSDELKAKVDTLTDKDEIIETQATIITNQDREIEHYRSVAAAMTKRGDNFRDLWLAAKEDKEEALTLMEKYRGLYQSQKQLSEDLKRQNRRLKIEIWGYRIVIGIGGGYGLSRALK
jgi:septal ring factor EnvC (AmiA/AmiB activator)